MPRTSLLDEVAAASPDTTYQKSETADACAAVATSAKAPRSKEERRFMGRLLRPTEEGPFMGVVGHEKPNALST
jgi:hypothetical protein